MIYFTSSWDDGSIHDIRLADLLLKYDQNATFFIPLANVEKRAVINDIQICDLSEKFEIGAHTLNHKYLTTIPDQEAEYEIKQSKKNLEDIIKKPVQGFCFPGGKYSREHLRYVYEAGFEYARTVNMFKFENKNKLMNTTLNAFNHSKYTYFKHLLKRGYINEIIQNSFSILKNNKWDKLLFDIIERHAKKNPPSKITIIHLTGHSWEIEEYKMWNQLEDFLRVLKTTNIPSITNLEVFKLNKK